MYSLQFTRNTQANAKTVSNVAQVLNPAKNHQALSVSNKPKSIALSLDTNSQKAPEGTDQEGRGSRLGSLYTSLTNLNTNGGKAAIASQAPSYVTKGKSIAASKEAENEGTPDQNQLPKGVYGSANKMTPFKLKTQVKLKTGAPNTGEHTLTLNSPRTNTEFKAKVGMTPSHLMPRLPER